jgi:hypothetical protein
MYAAFRLPSDYFQTAFMNLLSDDVRCIVFKAGEGTISETALWRAPRIFVLQTGLWRCQPQEHW